jgi:hypothetical protein
VRPQFDKPESDPKLPINALRKAGRTNVLLSSSFDVSFSLCCVACVVSGVSWSACAAVSCAMTTLTLALLQIALLENRYRA